MDEKFILESKRENVESHESALEEVDPLKDKKGFETQRKKTERKTIVSCYENPKGIEDFVNTLPYIDGNENPKNQAQISPEQSNDCHMSRWEI